MGSQLGPQLQHHQDQQHPLMKYVVIKKLYAIIPIGPTTDKAKENS